MTQIRSPFGAASNANSTSTAQHALRHLSNPHLPSPARATPHKFAHEVADVPAATPTHGASDDVLHTVFFPTTDTERQTVLIVDDEPCIAGLLAELLEGAGYRALTAGNGQVALTIVKVVHPELVLSDCIMPELDGVGLVKAIRAQPATRDIPLVLMSSTRPEASTLGEIPFLEKPFDLEQVLDLVELYAAETQSL